MSSIVEAALKDNQTGLPNICWCVYNCRFILDFSKKLKKLNKLGKICLLNASSSSGVWLTQKMKTFNWNLFSYYLQ